MWKCDLKINLQINFFETTRLHGCSPLDLLLFLKTPRAPLKDCFYVCVYVYVCVCVFVCVLQSSFVIHNYQKTYHASKIDAYVKILFRNFDLLTRYLYVLGM